MKENFIKLTDALVQEGVFTKDELHLYNLNIINGFYGRRFQLKTYIYLVPLVLELRHSELRYQGNFLIIILIQTTIFG